MKQRDGCDHGVDTDFKKGGLWVCSHCGKKGAWSDSWSYHGNLECRHCWRAAIDFVACSEACMSELQSSKTLEAAQVTERRRKATVAEIDRQIAELTSRREQLAGKKREPVSADPRGSA